MHKNEMKNWLAYYELHVEEHTYYLNFIIKAETEEAALKKFNTLKGRHGKHHHLQLKGMAGPLEENMNLLQEVGGGIDVK